MGRPGGLRAWLVRTALRLAFILVCLFVVGFIGTCVLSHRLMEREYEYFDEPRAEQWSPDELRKLIRDSEHDLLAVSISPVNRADHPWLTTLLLDELGLAIEEDRRDRSLALVETISWCSWEARESVRVFCWQQARRSDFGQEIAVRLLRAMGDGRDLKLLVDLSLVNNPEVAQAAGEALEDLFGIQHAKGASEITVPIPGSTPWLLRRVTKMRRWPLTREERSRRLVWDELVECPEESRTRLLRLVLQSCMLPVEEFPGEREFATLGTGFYIMEWNRYYHAEHHFKSLGRRFSSALLELSAEIQQSKAHRYQRQFWKLLSGSLYSYKESTLGRLYQSWIDFEMDEPTRFYFLMAVTRFDLPQRSSRELRLFAGFDLEQWRVERHDAFHSILRSVERLIETDIPGLRTSCWRKPSCAVDLPLLRELLGRDYIWDPEVRKFKQL